MKKLVIASLLLLQTNFGISQVTVKSADSLFTLTVTFPALNDTVPFAQVRVTGITDKAAVVSVNQKNVRTFANGAFVTRVELEPGLNNILIKASKNNQTIGQELAVYRPPLPESYPPQPTAIDTMLIEPLQNVMLLFGDYLNVKCKGSPGGEMVFSIDKVAKELPMVELPPALAGGLAGVYNGVVRINEGPLNKPLSIKFELKGQDGKKIDTQAPGHVYIMPDDVPVTGKINKETWLYNNANGSMPFTRIQDSVMVHIIGKDGNYFKIRLSATVICYVKDIDVDLQPWGTPLPYTEISAPVIYSDNDWNRLNMRVMQPVPFAVEQTLDPPALTVTFFGANLVSNWITFPNNPLEIKQINFSHPQSRVLQMKVALNFKQFWGYRAFYDEFGFQLKIRKTPRWNENVFNGMVIAIDAGHGGKNKGAISPSGVLEKDVNLDWAMMLADSLRAAGASVALTRTTDEDISLAGRVQIARSANANFLVSLHNNSTTAGGDALTARGTSAYFTLPQNRDLAWAIYPHLLKLGLAPYGRIYNSYYLTRTTDMPVVLIEGGFLSHPEEELLLTNPAFMGKMSAAVVNGIKEYLQNQQKK